MAWSEWKKFSGNKCYLVGTFDINQTKTFDISSISGYENLTADNFLVSPSWLQVRMDGPNLRASGSVTKSYDASTGILTINSPNPITNQYNGFSARIESITAYVWLCSGTIENI